MIFDWLFKRSKKSNNKEAVAPVFIDVPTREDLIKNNQTEMIKLLDQYKKEYKDKLKERLLFSDISSADLSKKYLENQDIIIKHIMSNNYTGIDEILASGSTEELLEAKLEYLKLYILNEENNKIHNEMLLRYIALTELKKKAYFIRPIQRRAIMNELDFLYSSLVVCKSNSFATNANCRLYLIRMSQINSYITNLGDEESKLLNEKKRLITKLANTFIKDKYDSIFNSNMQVLGIVSYLEIELEKYYLKHRKEFELLDEELDKFDEQEITSDNKEELLKKIEFLESKYLLFNIFNEVPKITYERLYMIKFSILTSHIYCFGESVISKEDFGYKHYKNIVEEKVNIILSGNNKYINNLFTNLRESERHDLINNYFKWSFENIEELLNSMLKLSILLSFDRENGFDELLNNTLIRKNDLNAIYSVICHNDHHNYGNIFYSESSDSSNDIEWDDNIPLKSILEIIRRKSCFAFFGIITKLYAQSNLTIFRNQLPEGIIKYSIVDDEDHNWYFRPIRHASIDRHHILPPSDYDRYSSVEIKLPRTIKEFNNCDTRYYYVTELPFGIEKISFNINQIIPPIPPTVNEITLFNTVSDIKIKKEKIVLKFLDFKNSALLKSPEMVNKLLRSLPDGTYYIELEDNGKIFTYEIDNIDSTNGIRYGGPRKYFISNEGAEYGLMQHIINETGYNIFTGETTPWLRKTKKRS